MASGLFYGLHPGYRLSRAVLLSRQVQRFPFVNYSTFLIAMPLAPVQVRPRRPGIPGFPEHTLPHLVYEWAGYLPLFFSHKLTAMRISEFEDYCSRFRRVESTFDPIKSQVRNHVKKILYKKID
jgi:hypothetical protein